MLQSADLTTIDRSFPVLEEGTCRVKLSKFDTKENRDKTGHLLIIDLVLQEPRKTDEGKLMNPGFKFQDMVSLVKTEKYNPLEKLADIQLAVYGEQRKGFSFGDYAGRDVVVRLSIEDDPTYGKRNRVRYIRRKDVVGQAAAVPTL